MRAFKGVPGLLATIPLVVACGGSSGDDDDYEAVVEEQRTWSAAGVAAMTMATEIGDVVMAGANVDTITADITRMCDGSDRADAAAHIDDVGVTDSMIGDTLTLEAAMPSGLGRQYRADFDVTGPAWLPVNIVTINGDVTALDMTGAAVLTATNGVVRTENHKGLLDANVVNGSIDADLASLQSPDSAILSIANGNARLSLPSETGVSFDVASASGDARVLGFRYVAYTLNTANRKKGTINGGGAIVEITAVNGDATLQAR